MPISRTKNENFFKKWIPEMAYVLGFITADGALTKSKRGAKFIEIQSVDKEIVYEIRKALCSNLAIGEYQPKHPNQNKRFRLQIGSKRMYEDLLKLGLAARKAYRIRIPPIPSNCIRDFIRGYFDGDGGISLYLSHKKDRKTPTKVLLTTFTSCSKGMLNDIAALLSKRGGTRLKVAQKKWGDNAFELRYSTVDSRKIYYFLYRNQDQLFLRRKKIVFEKYLRA